MRLVGALVLVVEKIEEYCWKKMIEFFIKITPSLLLLAYTAEAVLTPSADASKHWRFPPAVCVPLI